MSQPTKEQLILEWEIATNEAMSVLAEWAKQLETWRLSGATIPDAEFMAAYANLANNLGDWPDWAVASGDSYSIDALREALTGVDLSQPVLPDEFEIELVTRLFDPENEGFEPANGDEWAPYVSGLNTFELTEDGWFRNREELSNA